MECYYCGDEIYDGVIKQGAPVCYRCLKRAPEREDTPSLQGRDPEGYGYITNTNPWGQEGGY